ncbi:hypothetical protein T06_4809, partial [Trichinella sp. T6]
DFHYSPSRLNQPRTKHYCKKISKKLFPDYYDRRTTERICSNMYIYSDFSIDIVLIIEKSNLKRNRNVLLYLEYEAWQKIIRRLTQTDLSYMSTEYKA